MIGNPKARVLKDKSHEQRTKKQFKYHFLYLKVLVTSN